MKKIKIGNNDFEIRDTAKVYHLVEYTDGTSDYMIMDHAEFFDDYFHFPGEVFCYAGRYTLVIVNDDVTGCRIIKDDPPLGEAYVKTFTINNDIWSKMSRIFKRNIDVNTDLNEKEKAYLEEHYTTDISYIKICGIDEGYLVVNKIYCRKTALERRCSSFSNVFFRQMDIFGPSKKNEQVYSLSCSKEEYDDALFKTLSDIGIKKFEL